MHFSILALFSGLAVLGASAQSLTSDSLETHVDSLTLSASFNPVKEAYWTGYPHHRRTPFAVSPDGSVGYVAYLSASDTDVIVQPVDPTTFAATGTPVTVTGAKEAGGLVAHNDGFALLTNEALPSGTTNAPADSTPVAVLYRYDASGTQTWKTFLGGPGVSESFGLMASPDLNGDLVYSEASGYYAAYFVVTAYTGDAAGHYGDAIRYVDASTGALETISGASSDWGCSHNTGIAFEAADQPPFASICAEDQGAIWLNTRGQGMYSTGVKISNENTTNGGSGEPMNGMSGSYSQLARFDGSDSYIFAWVSRGAALLKANDWMGNGYTAADNRTNGRNIAVAIFSDKNTIVGDQASSTVGDTEGDKQINWITESTTADASNVHAAAFGGGDYALVTWEEIASPRCDFVAMGCGGEFTGSLFQLVASDGSAVGEPVRSMDTFVAGDMVTMGDGRICWPYVSMDWSLERNTAADVKSLSFACANIGSSGSGSSPSSSAAPTTSAAASSAPASAEASTPAEGTSTAAPVESSAPVEVPDEATPTPVLSTESALPTVAVPTSSAGESSASAPVPTQRPSSGQTTLRTQTRTRSRAPCTRRS